ncbi:MAG: hypothetical protein RL702_3160, partial [Pseudomonadota bacterium]
WHPGSYDPATGLYYAPVQDMANLMFVPPGPNTYQPKGLNTDAALIFSPDLEAALPTLPPPLAAAVEALPAYAEVKRKPYSSELRALDPLTGKTKWAVPMKGWQDRGGVLTTASGLVFQGSIDGYFNVYDKASGKLLKSIDTGTSMLAAPMTYRVAGVQYVAVMAAWGGGGFPYVPRYSAAYARGNAGRLLVFKLGGTAKLPEPGPLNLPPLDPPALTGTPEQVADGAKNFGQFCGVCHGDSAIGSGVTRDLRRAGSLGDAKLWNQIVIGGALAQNGMISWKEELNDQQAENLRQYVIKRAQEDKALGMK